MKTKRQESGTPPTSQEAKVANAHETFGEQMQQEAAHELIERQSQQLLFVVVSGVAPAKRDLAIRERDQAMVGDGHAMSVAAQILEYIFRAPEGWFRVHHPVFSEQPP